MHVPEILSSAPLAFRIAPIPYGLLFWGAYFWTQKGERKPTQSDEPAGDSLDCNSWDLIRNISRVTRGLALVVAFVATPIATGAAQIALYVAGVALMLLGTNARRACFDLLKDSFTAQVKAPKDGIVDRGIYRFVRHPSYTAGMVFIAGFGLAMTNWWSLAIMVLGGVVMYAYRVPVEERAMVAVLGEPYVDYMRRTKRFIPFIV